MLQTLAYLRLNFRNNIHMRATILFILENSGTCSRPAQSGISVFLSTSLLYVRHKK